MRYLNEYKWRHAISATVAVIISIFIEWQFARSHEGWVVLSALLTSQTTRGTPFKQGLYYYILISFGILATTVWANVLPSIFILQIVAVAFFMLTGLVVFRYRPLQETAYFTIMLLPLTMLIAVMLTQANSNLLAARLTDVLYGSIIGIACGQVIFPVRPYQDMVAGLTSILNAFSGYCTEMASYFSSFTARLEKERHAMELSLQISGGMYPEWIYEAGFNPGLRAGYRYFLVHIERVSELLFAIDSILTRGVRQYLSKDTQAEIAKISIVNADLVNALSKKLNGGQVDVTGMDLVTDIDALEKSVEDIVLTNVDLLGVTKESGQVAMLVRNLKDVRKLLLQLLLSVPEMEG